MKTRENEPTPDPNQNRLSRREVMRFFAGAGAMIATGGVELPAAEATPAVAGYGTDPNVVKIYKPGDVWPLTMTPAQRAATGAFADVLLPADDLGPAASALRVPDFIDEWVSAPYPSQQKERPVILDGLAWLDEEARKRFAKDFAALNLPEQTAICDDICEPAKDATEFKKAAKFFQVFRQIAMGAYYSTQEGWAAIGYVGNLPSATFDGPPPEVLEKLGLKQTVK